MIEVKLVLVYSLLLKWNFHSLIKYDTLYLNICIFVSNISCNCICKYTFKIGISTAIFIKFGNLNGVTEVWNWVFTGETENSKWKTVREQIDQPGFLRKEHLDKCWRETKGRDFFALFVNLSEWSWQCKQ